MPVGHANYIQPLAAIGHSLPANAIALLLSYTGVGHIVYRSWVGIYKLNSYRRAVANDVITH